eukprot:TRINITY_DN4_c0_g1_i1.p2 TRINITY_DN4_c0_g1~~TRINITY_DN4_c0_g1_i1.p2  ORF type:complete len:194 (+),score=75.43 TRINITY_DN4_c0_g1_i1:128-709(+)
MVLISRKDKRTVFQYLLEEGVIVIKKDFALPQHPETRVPNLHVWMMLRSLKSKGLVELVFNWRHYYYFLKKEGVEWLRGQLGIVGEVVPITHKKTNKNYRGEEADEGEGGRGRGRRGGDRRGGDRRGGPRRGYGRGRITRQGEGDEGQPEGGAPEGGEQVGNEEAYNQDGNVDDVLLFTQLFAVCSHFMFVTI